MRINMRLLATMAMTASLGGRARITSCIRTAFILALALIPGAGCGSTEQWPVAMGDAGHDPIPDPVTEPRTDAPEVDAPVDTPVDTSIDTAPDVLPELPADACTTICAFMEACGRGTGTCATFCDRTAEGVRLCLLDLASSANCDGIDACYADAPPPPECDPVCEFAQACTLLMPVNICEDGCSLMSSDLLACAEAAMAADDCQDMLDCMLYPGGLEEQCDAVCNFAIVDCGLDIGGISPALCSLGCQSGFILEEGIVDCLSYGAMLRSCLLLAGCAALYGITPAP